MNLHCFTQKISLYCLCMLIIPLISMAQPTNCVEDFNNQSNLGPVTQAGNWHSVLSDLYFLTDPFTFSPVLSASDASGASFMSNITDYDLNWYARYGGCQFCFDIRYDEGTINPGNR
ncbi:MAG: hypothetical protein IPG95_00735 [Saprospiraceae bacterium]|nr:hypothetical protein [Saprospiraceae bacterium]